ncbi:MAG: hypothetical protein IT336_00605, partial [Thermomicrobiales bacterium]|nr:hypothetical protein [Thermomicrobiales bacterium]
FGRRSGSGADRGSYGRPAQWADQNRAPARRTCTRSKPLVSGDRSAVVAPLPLESPKRAAGRPRLPNRHHPRAGTRDARSDVAHEMGCGAGVTRGRRPRRDVQQTGVRDRPRRERIDRVGETGRIAWAQAALDSASVRVKLEMLDHSITAHQFFHWELGGGQAIFRHPASGAFIGGADLRRDGYVTGW